MSVSRSVRSLRVRAVATPRPERTFNCGVEAFALDALLCCTWFCCGWHR